MRMGYDSPGMNKQELQIPENDELHSIYEKNLKNAFLSRDILKKGMIKEASATVKLDPEDMRKQEIQFPISKEFNMKDPRNKFQLIEEIRTYSSNFDLQKQEPFITKNEIENTSTKKPEDMLKVL